MTPTAPPRILVVDDQPQDRVLLADVLLRAGYTVVVAACPKDALALCRTLEPALIVTDLLMWPEGGVDLLRSLRALPGGADVPVIVISGYHSPAIAAVLAPFSVTAYVRKSFTSDGLLQAVAAALRPTPGGP